jgi:hypothetical protein
MQTVRGQQGPVVVAGGVGVVVTTTAGSVMVRDGVVWQAGAVTTGSTAMPLVHWGIQQLEDVLAWSFVAGERKGERKRNIKGRRLALPNKETPRASSETIDEGEGIEREDWEKDNIRAEWLIADIHPTETSLGPQARTVPHQRSRLYQQRQSQGQDVVWDTHTV